MPELPEVETIVRDLGPRVAGLTFRGISGEWEKSVVPHFKAFDYLKGAKVTYVSRRGKFLNIFFDQDFVLTVHLRMSGRLLLRDLNDPKLKFERVRLDFNDISLRFCDVRKFGRIWLNKLSDYEKNTGIWKLGPEPLDKSFGLDNFLDRMKNRRGLVKRWLLDQSAIAGIGNIYADESCFHAGIRPDSRIENLTNQELKKLFNGIKETLMQGIRNRGTSISDFQDAYGKTGRNQETVYVYGRGGQKCLNCNSILEKIKVSQRSTVYCACCQKLA